MTGSILKDVDKVSLESKSLRRSCSYSTCTCLFWSTRSTLFLLELIKSMIFWPLTSDGNVHQPTKTCSSSKPHFVLHKYSYIPINITLLDECCFGHYSSRFIYFAFTNFLYIFISLQTYKKLSKMLIFIDKLKFAVCTNELVWIFSIWMNTRYADV